jgi:hypothetical protein
MAVKGGRMRLRIRQSVRASVRWVWVPVVAFVLVVTVAMACAVWSPLLKLGDRFDSFDNRYFEIPGIMRQYGSDGRGGVEVKGWGVSLYHINFRAMVTILGKNTTEDKRKVDGVKIYVGRSGLPFRCMRWRYSLYRDMDDFSPFVIGIETTRPSSMYGRGRRIPLMPEPVGMVLNVLIFSAVIVLVHLAWRRVVVIRRRRKNLCVKCGYPIVPSVSTCPECGGVYLNAEGSAAG